MFYVVFSFCCGVLMFAERVIDVLCVCYACAMRVLCVLCVCYACDVRVLCVCCACAVLLLCNLRELMM